MKKFLTAFVCLILFSPAYAKTTFFIQHSFSWSKTNLQVAEGPTLERLTFPGAIHSDETPLSPYFMRTFSVAGPGSIAVRIISAEYESFTWNSGPLYPEAIGEELLFKTALEKDRSGYYAKVLFVPVIRSGSTWRRLKNVRLEVTVTERPAAQLRSDPFAARSVLADGDIYQLAVAESNMYRLGYGFLRDELGISNLEQIDPANLALYGHGGGMLPAALAPERPDDLVEIPLQVVGGEDGRFDQDDYILFYGEGPSVWRYSATEEDLRYQQNIYTTRNVYFLKVGNAPGLRISSREPLDQADYQTAAFDDIVRLEEEEVNLLHFWGQELSKSQGSGQNWFGDYFLRTRTYTYRRPFQFPNRVADEPIRVRASMALRALRPSRFFVSVNDAEPLPSQTARAIRILSGPRDNEFPYAERANLDGTVSATGEQLSIEVNYPYPEGPDDGSQGWLDYLEVRVRRELRLDGSNLVFRDLRSTRHTATQYTLTGNTANYTVWDITDPVAPVQQQLVDDGVALRFGAASNTLRTFVAFRPGQASTAVEALGLIPNQNLHGIDRVDMVIVYPEGFAPAAETLAEHRRNYSGLTVVPVAAQAIYNEFSSGKQDPAAIRDFCHMLYQRDPNFRYLLLLGDGSFDARNIYDLGSNLLPTYQRVSFNPLFTFPTDDYYGLFEETNPLDPLVGRINLAIGRLPVQTLQQAQTAVRKVIHYDTSPRALTDWRNQVVFLADDEDNNRHIIDANTIANNVAGTNPDLNIEKIYLDAYPQESTPGGNRNPAVNAAINRSIFKGALVLTYLGHGGSEGLAQERVLNISDIINWTNFDNLTLFLTATCSFTGYDDPAFITAGEEAILNPRGGAIALMTTVRAVFASQNAALTRETMEALYTPLNGAYPTLGEAIRIGKNNLSGSNITVNSRKFTLIGDPAQRLAIPDPQRRVVTTAIDTAQITQSRNDTLRALQRVTVTGRVQKADGTLDADFSGIVYPTIFDKPVQNTTLAQDPGSRPFTYSIQKNVLFRGRARVTNGTFTFSFVVPKDIDYAFGRGKISYYAASGQSLADGSGSYENIVIGGNIDEEIADDAGPEIEVFMNTDDFVFGGITDPDPTLLVRLEDDFGINVVGNSIGHDLEAIIDEDTQNSILLNDFFESELDDFTRGEVRFPLEDLEEGRHSIRIKAWDVANNSAEGYTEFVVAESSELILEHVLNYPNPFTDRTCFQFDHNYANQDLSVLIQIFTVSGRLVKTIDTQLFSDGAIRLDDCISWDGRDDFGDRLARGVYLYKIKVRANVPGMETIEGESDFEKLVILK